jgi:Fe-S-cluster containining protein
MLRIAVLGESPCAGCRANCCRQNGHEYAVLLEDRERRKFAPFAEQVAVNAESGVAVESVLPYRDGRCIFLGSDNLCTIYEDRPANCRRFQCVSGFHLAGSDIERHSIFLDRNRDVLVRIQQM